MSSTLMPPYRLKIERAKRHIRELATEIEAFHASEPYGITVDDDVQRGHRIWKLKVKQCVSEQMSTIVGDVIHNIRTSLDLLMCALVRHDDPTRQSVKHVHFVVRETKTEFEKALPKNVKGALPATIALVHDLKPYKGGNEPLWRVHQLDILDKHQAIIPVGAAHRSVGIIFELPPIVKPWGTVDAVPPITVFLRPADTQFPLQDGAELYSMPINLKGEFNQNPQFRFEVAFGEGQIVDGEPVVPALTQLCEAVEGVFDVFESAVLSK